jgi:hypothetical protein
VGYVGLIYLVLYCSVFERNHWHGMDGRRSCDAAAHPHITKTSTLKMIRRLSVRDHMMKSPPSPDHDAKSKGLVLRFPRFSAAWGHASQPQKLVEACTVEDGPRSSSHKTSTTFKGTLARLFLKEPRKSRRKNA